MLLVILNVTRRHSKPVSPIPTTTTTCPPASGDLHLLCSDCASSFVSTSELVLHQMSVHKTFRPFVCLFCGKTASKRERIAKHLRAIHRYGNGNSKRGYNVENLVQVRKQNKLNFFYTARLSSFYTYRIPPLLNPRMKNFSV